jgi:hypothetical protein
MFKKYMERKFSVDSYDGVRLDPPIDLEYYLIENDPADSHVYDDSCKAYGMGIVRKIGDSCFEEKMVRHYSNCPVETRNVLVILADNSVTPCCMLQVLDDLLGAF